MATARGFISKGTGATDAYYAKPLVAMPTFVSVFQWLNRAGAGGGGLGKPLALSDINGVNNVSAWLQWNNGSTRWEWNEDWSGTSPGVWSFAGATTTGVWNAIGISHKASAAANQPTCFVNGSAATVTTRTTPTGAKQGTIEQWALGNRLDGFSDGYDGSIGITAIWKRILTNEEHRLLGQGVHPWRFRAGLIFLFDPDFGPFELISNSPLGVNGQPLSVRQGPRTRELPRKRPNVLYRLAPASGAMQATIAGVGGTSFDLRGVGALADTIAGTAGTSLDLRGSGALADAIAAVGGTSFDLRGAGALTEVAAALGGASLDLRGAGELDLVAQGVGAAALDLRGAGALAATEQATGGASLTIVAAIAETAQATGGASLDARGAGELDASIAAVAATSLDLRGTGVIVETSLAVAGTSFDLRGAGELDATIQAKGAASLDLRAGGELDAAIAAVGGASLDIRGKGALSSTEQATGGASLTIVAAIDATIDGVAGVSFDGTTTGGGAGPMIAEEHATTGVSFDLAGSSAPSATVAGVAATSLDLEGAGVMHATIAGAGGASLDLRGAGELDLVARATAGSFFTIVAAIVERAQATGGASLALTGAGVLSATEAAVANTSFTVGGSVPTSASMAAVGATSLDAREAGALSILSASSTSTSLDARGAGALATLIQARAALFAAGSVTSLFTAQATGGLVAPGSLFNAGVAAHADAVSGASLVVGGSVPAAARADAVSGWAASAFLTGSPTFTSAAVASFFAATSAIDGAVLVAQATAGVSFELFGLTPVSFVVSMAVKVAAPLVAVRVLEPTIWTRELPPATISTHVMVSKVRVR